jgi:hypothetical protein
VKVIATAAVGFSSMIGDKERHTVAVASETTSSAGTLANSPSSKPIAPPTSNANIKVVSSPKRAPQNSWRQLGQTNCLTTQPLGDVSSFMYTKWHCSTSPHHGCHDVG